jgi:hypothetical protein
MPEHQRSASNPFALPEEPKHNTWLVKLRNQPL